MARPRWCDTRRRKSEPTGNTNFGLKPARRSPTLPVRDGDGNVPIYSARAMGAKGSMRGGPKIEFSAFGSGPTAMGRNSCFSKTLRWTAGMRKQRSVVDGLANVPNGTYSCLSRFIL